ncbi:MAG: transposase [Anaerolineae bacterium]|nr:MAG: transposase [Anaerolineae bacterium]
MNPEESMTIDERRKYLHKMQDRYWKATRNEKGRLLDDMQAVTGLHRKSLIRLLRGDLRRKPRQRQRGFTYGAVVRDAVQLCAQALDYPAAERLKPVLGQTARDLARHGHLHLNEALIEALEVISASTVHRIVGPVLRKPQRLGSPRKPGRRRPRQHSVPIRTLPNSTERPGCLEADTVQHSGPEASGQYAYSLCLTNVATGWVGTQATLGNSGLVMEDAFRGVLYHLPFLVQEIHSDNGSEFLNQIVVSSLQEQGISLSRSRPYHKNDNRFVEENNNSHIRAYIGYARFDTLAQVEALNTVYRLLNLYHNFFLPVMRTIRDAAGQKHTTVNTPWQRLKDSGVLDDEAVANWETFRQHIDPLCLKRSIEAALHTLDALPGAVPGHTEDVRQSLGVWKTGTTLRSASGCPPFPTPPATATAALPLKKISPQLE